MTRALYEFCHGNVPCALWERESTSTNAIHARRIDRSPRTTNRAKSPASAKRQASRQSPTRSRTMRRYVRCVRVTVPESRRMVALYIAAGASFAALSARGLTVPLYAHDLGANRFEVGALFSVSTLAAALLSLPSGVLGGRFGARSLVSISFLPAG